jgi:crotonobetainyl-CoA:carnitine CoA-transferase CaiB-like acyl-CoA transferase
VIDAVSCIAGPAAPQMADIPVDPQMADSGALVPSDDPRAGAALIVGSPHAIEGVVEVPPRVPPAPGEHSVEVLREVGDTDARLWGRHTMESLTGRLRSGLIGPHPVYPRMVRLRGRWP